MKYNKKSSIRLCYSIISWFLCVFYVRLSLPCLVKKGVRIGQVGLELTAEARNWKKYPSYFERGGGGST